MTLTNLKHFQGLSQKPLDQVREAKTWETVAALVASPAVSYISVSGVKIMKKKLKNIYQKNKQFSCSYDVTWILGEVTLALCLFG